MLSLLTPRAWLSWLKSQLKPPFLGSFPGSPALAGAFPTASHFSMRLGYGHLSAHGLPSLQGELLQSRAVAWAKSLAHSY